MGKWSERLLLHGVVRKLSPALLSPIIPTIVTCGALIVGVLGAVWPEEIKRAFPFAWGPNLIWQALVFWVVTIVTSLLFFFRQTADDLQKDAAQTKLEAQANKLENLIRTMPPAGFLLELAKAQNRVSAIQRAIPGTKAENLNRELAQSIRCVLKILADMAKSFDDSPADCVYAANLMFYFDGGSLSIAASNRLIGKVSFCEEGVSANLLGGVLTLDREFSCVAGDASFSADPGLAPFIALPVPKRTQSKDGRAKLLPGAPYAIVKREPEFCPDTTEFGEWIEQNSDLSADIARGLGDYFERYSQIRSFISMPLCGYTDVGMYDRESQPKAVLNIHSNHRKMLKGQAESANQFAVLMRPIELVLLQLAEKAIEVRGEELIP